MNAGEFSWSTFFAMGGYALYVWTCYGLTFVVLLANVIWPLWQRKQVIARVRRALRREQQAQQSNIKVMHE
jgi:heme exporter protein D